MALAQDRGKSYCASVTLRRWERQGLIKCRQVPGHHRSYDVGSVGTSTSSTTSTPTTVSTAHHQSTPPSEEKINYIYARVSSRKQQSDLQRQVDELRRLFPDNTVVSDIGSGINFKRHGLKALLERSSRGLVGEVVVAHRDRLCRFAFDLLEFIFRLHDTRIHVVHADLPSSEAGAQELSENILAINTVFICRLQGKRAAENRRRRRLQGQREGQATGEENVLQEEEAENGAAHQEVGVRLYPNGAQKALMRRWMGCARKVYNMVVSTYHRTRRLTSQWFFRWVLKLNIQIGGWGYMRKVPYDVLDHAIIGAIRARDEVAKRNWDRRQAGGGGSFHRLHFQKLKEDRQTITIRAQYCRPHLLFYKRLLHDDRNLLTQNAEKWPRWKDFDHIPHLFRPPLHHEKIRNNHCWPDTLGQVKYDSTLTYDRRRRCWTFNWVYEKDALVDDNQVDQSVVALDPGVVSFYTFYSPTHGVGHIARNDIQKIVRLSLYLDKLVSATTSAPIRKRCNMRRAQARIRQRIRNLVDELHKKVALWLVRTFDIVILPAFRSTEMSLRRPQRKIGSKTVRKMMTWAHSRFLQRLKHKAEEFGKSVVVLSSEAYTSKTCSRCGVIRNNLGGARIFRCKTCGYVVDRDVNGARGIFLRALRFGDITLV